MQPGPETHQFIKAQHQRSNFNPTIAPIKSGLVRLVEMETDSCSVSNVTRKKTSLKVLLLLLWGAHARTTV